MPIRKDHRFDAPESSVTPESAYLNRRAIFKAFGAGTLAYSASANAGLLDIFGSDTADKAAKRKPLSYRQDSPKPVLEATPEIKIMNYNNYYEFGTDKADPVRYAQELKTEPWTVRIEGEVAKPGTVDVNEILNSKDLVERIYRMRCVEAWSMVVPWVGIELGKFLQRFEPTSKAKYVAFETLYDPKQMRGQASRFVGGGVDYPYVEGLRIDEAMHPLTLLTVGLYGKTLPPQNGAPLRLIVPWKYGFKGIKAIVKIRLTDKQPPTTWNLLAPDEYGFYANVNPAVDHPRWSQASERFIGPGGPLNVVRQATLPFNGYAEQVAHLYKGMDLHKFY